MFLIGDPKQAIHASGAPTCSRQAEAKKGGNPQFPQVLRVLLPETFDLPWSADHLTVIRQIEESVLRGGLFATAMPRGSGKTSLAEAACIWAILYGHRTFVVLIGIDEEAGVGDAREHQDGSRGQRDTAGGFPRGGLPDPLPGGHLPPLQRADSRGRADSNRMDGGRNRDADDTR